MKLARLAPAILVGLALVWQTNYASAINQNQIIFNSFNGIYHLSRDRKGLSLLTTEETIVADFGSGFYGITRELPSQYQGHSVDIKILGVVDAASNPVPYKVDNKG